MRHLTHLDLHVHCTSTNCMQSIVFRSPAFRAPEQKEKVKNMDVKKYIFLLMSTYILQPIKLLPVKNDMCHWAC